MSKPDQSKIDPRETFRSARRTHVSAELLRDETHAMHERYGSSGDHVVLAPFFYAVITYAFSLELYLKCLYLLESKPYPEKGKAAHDLFQLFEGLGPLGRDFVREAEEQLSLRDRVEPELKTTGSLYVEWRYNYEEKPSDCRWTIDWPSGRAFRRTIMNLRPEFRDVDRLAWKAQTRRRPFADEDMQRICFDSSGGAHAAYGDYEVFSETGMLDVLADAGKDFVPGSVRTHRFDRRERDYLLHDMESETLKHFLNAEALRRNLLVEVLRQNAY